MRIDGGTLGLVQPANKAANSLKQTNKELSRILERLSTSLKINSASDDASGLSISEQLRTQVRGFKAASDNVSQAMSALNIADSTGQQVSNMVQRQHDLALQSSSGTLNDTQRQYINTEYQSLTQEITRITSAAQFNTQNVANGTGLASGNAQIQAGANAGDQVSMPYADMSAQALQITGTSVDTAANAQNAIDKLSTALDKLNSQRSDLGAMTNRFQSTVNNLSVAEVNTQAAESALRDQDTAMGLADLARAQLLQQGATSAFAKFNQISSNNLFGLTQ